MSICEYKSRRKRLRQCCNVKTQRSKRVPNQQDMPLVPSNQDEVDIGHHTRDYRKRNELCLVCSSPSLLKSGNAFPPDSGCPWTQTARSFFRVLMICYNTIESHLSHTKTHDNRPTLLLLHPFCTSICAWEGVTRNAHCRAAPLLVVQDSVCV